MKQFNIGNMNPNYAFLNDYLNKINQDSQSGGEITPLEDDNDFYNTDQDQQDNGDGYTYTLSDSNDDQQDDQDIQENEDQDGDYLDSLMPSDEDPYSGVGFGDDEEGDYENETSSGAFSPFGNTRGSGNESSTSSLANKISANESGGDYSAVNNHGGGSGAIGKYQFRWNIWKDSIKEITGVKNKEQFRNSPDAQEKYFAWYEKNYLKPDAQTLQKYNKQNLDTDQLEELVHYRGFGGAKKYLQGKVKDKPESYNVPISKYIAKKQMGGRGVAISPESQYQGLNNNNYDELMFPMEGINTFRGLDSGEPVYLEDEYGKKKILKGKKDKTKMRGKVYEKRMIK